MNQWKSASRPARLGTTRWEIVLLALALTISAGAGRAFSQPAEASPPAAGRNAEARRAFEDAKFGLFIHWGVYSLLGKGEWVMDHDKLPIREYAKLPPRFNPTKFDADAWVKLAKAAGAQIHHDHQQAPRRLLHVRQPADRLRHRRRHALPRRPAQGPGRRLPSSRRSSSSSIIRCSTGTTPTISPWARPARPPAARPGETGNGMSLIYQGQVRELCTNYGEIGGIWFDGWWDRPDADWDLAGTYRLIHELQPGALVGNNHHVAPIAGRGLSDVRAGPARRERGRVQQGRRRGRPAAGNLPDDQSIVGLQRPRHQLQERRADHPGPGRCRGARGEPALERRAAARRHDRPGVPPSGCTKSANGWRPTASRSTAPAAGRSRRSPGASRRPRARRTDPARIYLHVLKPKDDEPIVFDPSLSWTPYLFGKTTPLKLTQSGPRPGARPAQGRRTPIDTIIVLTPKTRGR